MEYEQIKELCSQPVPTRTWDVLRRLNPNCVFKELDDSLVIRLGEAWTRHDPQGRVVEQSDNPNHRVQQGFTEDGYLAWQRLEQYGGFGFENAFSYETDPEGGQILVSAITQHFTASGNDGPPIITIF